MANSPRRSLLKKNKKKDKTAATGEQKPLTPESRPTTAPPLVGSTPAPAPHCTVIDHVDSLYQATELSAEEKEKMRLILAKRSSDLLPSQKGPVRLVEVDHIGLLINYACIGFLNGLLPAIVYPFFKLYLNMESYQVSAVTTTIVLPWSYKTFFGILTDHYPILGYRRKSYILLGWLVCFVALMVLAYSPAEQPYFKPGEIQRTRVIALRVVENPHAPTAGARYLAEMMCVCLGYVIADVACDGIMVELAQHEHIEVRGTAQSTIYTIRYTGNLMGAVTAAICFNGAEYGGTFKWSIHYEAVFFACAIITLLGSFATVFLLVEEPYEPENDRYPFREMWRIIKQRAIWQLMAFHFLNSLFSNFGFAGINAIQEYWVGVEPLNNSISTCFSMSLFIAATCLMKWYFLNASWRTMILLCSLFNTFVNIGVGLAVTYDVFRNQWFFLGGPQLAVIPDGMRNVVTGFVTVEIAEHGFEGATYSLLTTVHNLATPFASSITNLVDSGFAVSDADIATDSAFVRDQVAICLGIALAVQLGGLVTLYLLPDQKLEAQELKYHGTSSRVAGVLALVGVTLALTWATAVNFLAIHSSTACLRIAGGHGCP